MSGSSDEPRPVLYVLFLSGSSNQGRPKFSGPSNYAKKCLLARPYLRPCM